MHFVLLNARTRRISSVLAVLAALCVVSACGQNLGKSNFARTTAPAEAGSGQAPTGAINDPAVAVAVLRTIDPCPLVGKEVLGKFGVAEEPTPDSTSFGRCRTKVKDAGGKEFSVSVDFGASVIATNGTTTSAVDGLPQLEKKAKDGKSCDVGILTMRSPDRGILFTANYDGGDSCATARAVAQAAVKTLHASPPKYPESKGSLAPLDPCTAADEAVLKEVVPNGTAKLTNFHDCDWSPSTNPSVSTGFRYGLPPQERDGIKKIELVDGVSGYQKAGSGSTAECKIEWQHKQWTDDQVEIASVIYTNYDEPKNETTACEKAIKVAKSIVPKLPKP